MEVDKNHLGLHLDGVEVKFCLYAVGPKISHVDILSIFFLLLKHESIEKVLLVS